MRFSAPVKKHWLGSFSIVLPPSGLRAGPLGAGAARGLGAGGREGGAGIPWGGGGGGGGPEPESIYACARACACVCACVCVYVFVHGVYACMHACTSVSMCFLMYVLSVYTSRTIYTYTPCADDTVPYYKITHKVTRSFQILLHATTSPGGKGSSCATPSQPLLGCRVWQLPGRLATWQS